MVFSNGGAKSPYGVFIMVFGSIPPLILQSHAFTLHSSGLHGAGKSRQITENSCTNLQKTLRCDYLTTEWEDTKGKKKGIYAKTMASHSHESHEMFLWNYVCFVFFFPIYQCNYRQLVVRSPQPLIQQLFSCCPIFCLHSGGPWKKISKPSIIHMLHAYMAIYGIFTHKAGWFCSGKC